MTAITDLRAARGDRATRPSHTRTPRRPRIQILNVADDPPRPRIEKVIERDELVRATGLTPPHTVHRMPGDEGTTVFSY